MNRITSHFRLEGILFSALIGAALIIQGGCAAPWQNLKEGDLSKLTAATDLSFKKATFNDLKVGKMTEADYLAKKEEKGKDESIDKWQDNKVVWASKIGEATRDALVGNHITVKVVETEATDLSGIAISANIFFIEPGFYAAVVNKASQTRAHIKIFAVEAPDAPIAEFDIMAMTSPTEGMPSTGFGVAAPRYPSSGGRIGQDMEKLGNLVAKYIKVKRKNAGIK